MTERLYKPTKAQCGKTQLWQFMQFINQHFDLSLTHYRDLHTWSVRHRADFWESLAEYFDIQFHQEAEQVLVDGNKMPGATWFAGATLNFAEHCLQRRDNKPALIFASENGTRRQLTYHDLFQQTAACARALRDAGVREGSRIAGFMPNMPETVIAMLAAASIGATWSSCSPDFGYQAVLDRFGQIEPTILFAADGQFYNGKTHDVTDKIAALQSAIPSIKQVVLVPFVGSDASELDATRWDDFLMPCDDIEFAELPFDHPLYIMYSSGTTGTPKCIVHGAGGTLLQHIKELRLHTDLSPADTIFYFTTCGWMMWNWFVSSLAVGATLVLYDGAPTYPKPDSLLDLIDEFDISVFGTSATFIANMEKNHLSPKDSHRLAHLRCILSTGSPLAPHSFDYVYDKIKSNIVLSSISGGTDIISCFALGNPMLPVYRGEIQCLGLGMDVAVFNEDGTSIIDAKGELVCRTPFPSMPVGFFNDPDGAKYFNAYFARFNNTWAHGDYATINKHRGVVIYGRSDAVLNPGGVRIGTAEIYRQVETIDEVIASLVTAQQWDDSERVVLFVQLRQGLSLDDRLRNKIKTGIRKNASPRHVPAKICQVADIPRTVSGKIVELAVRQLIHGEPVKNQDALANPECLREFVDRPELQD
jgi:acetoacetyl-CoA synthetase